MTTDDFELMRQPTPAACARVLQAMGALTEQPPVWQPRQAPGSAMKPAADARQVWLMTQGWTKMSVPSEYEDVEGDGYYTNTVDGWKRYPVPAGPGEIEFTRALALPDQWPPQRHYHHAWYALSLEWKSRSRSTCWLRCDAVSQVGVLFVNGREAGRHLGGYTPFEFEITALLQEGVNTIAVWVQDDTGVKDFKQRRSVSQLDGSRGSIHGNMAGIRGGIYLERRAPLHVDRVRVRTSVRDRHIKVETWLRGNAAGAKVQQAVYVWPDGQQPVLELPGITVPQSGWDPHAALETEVLWQDPRLWSPARPHLYVLRTTLAALDGNSETFETRFGFREFRIEGRDFMLNGRPIRLFGDGSHPRELRSIVPARSRDFNRRWLEMLKREFNYMSTRLHGLLYPHWAVEAADEAGVLVINQSGLRCGELQFYENGGDELMRNLEAQFGEWYWRDVNNPAVVIWDVENELIRGQRFPEREKWVLQLDEFIRKHEPEAIIEHSGAAWYHPDQQIIHVHMQEQYSRIMREWNESGKIPLNMGEFWMGGRGETRLPTSLEYYDREDWHREEARLYREQMLEMRYYGVSGIMPHRLTHWPLIKPGALLAADDTRENRDTLYQWRFSNIRAYGARGIASVVGFVWPRGAAVTEGRPFRREIVVCNDREAAVDLTVRCRYAAQEQTWRVGLEPAGQRRLVRLFDAEPGRNVISVEVSDAEGRLLESDQVDIHALPPEVVCPPATRRRLVVVPGMDDSTRAELQAEGLSFEVSATLPEDAADTIVLVPEEVEESALGRNPSGVLRYLAAGGRLLVLAQAAAPRWLPLPLPFWTAVRSSVPEFDRGGWAPTNKDLIFTREAPVYAGTHPVLHQMAPCDFKEWHGCDGRFSDDVFIRPNAMKIRVDGAYRVLLGATRRENATLVECRAGAGTALLCQARVLSVRDCPAARALLCNALRYLDGPAWSAGQARIGLMGDLTPARLAALTGMDPAMFSMIDGAGLTSGRTADRGEGTPAPGAGVPDSGRMPHLVLAGDHADVGLIETLAQQGCLVLVLSAETCARLPGFEVERDDEAYYSGTRAGIEEHPLFWGVAGPGFLPLEDTPARGALRRIPGDARVLLAGQGHGHSPFRNDWAVDIGFFGLETREPAPPLAAAQRVGDGEIIATTLEPWNSKKETHRQLLANLLANAGVDLPLRQAAAEVVVKYTVPLDLDGRLDDWTSDMEDFNVSVHTHADPVVLTAADAVTGSPRDDLDYSGIIYLLYDREHLYAGGIIFSASEPGLVHIEIHDKLLEIDPSAKTVIFDNRLLTTARLAVGRQPADEVIDTRLLNLVKISRQIGRPESFTDTPGVTWETAIAWSELGCAGPPQDLSARFKLVRGDNTVLQIPAPDDAQAAAIRLRFQSDDSV